MDFAAVRTIAFPSHQANDAWTHWRNLFNELFDGSAVVYCTAAFWATVQWFFDLFVNVFGDGAIDAGMTGFLSRSFFLFVGNFLAVSSSKWCCLSGTGAFLLFELFAKETIFILQCRDGLFQSCDTLQ
jgi:hypothetical protein